MRLGPQSYVDAKHCIHNPARYINDCRNENGYNVEFLKIPEEGITRVVATRDVEAGHELYARYGKFYWLASHIHPTILSDDDLSSQWVSSSNTFRIGYIYYFQDGGQALVIHDNYSTNCSGPKDVNIIVLRIASTSPA